MTEYCVFCAIVAGQAPATIVDEWPDAIAIVPIDPVVDGHVLVIPRTHVADFASDPEVTAATMRRVAQFGTAPANVITSAGESATQTVFHLHVHIVPRSFGDGLALPWTGQTVAVTEPRPPVRPIRRPRLERHFEQMLQGPFLDPEGAEMVTPLRDGQHRITELAADDSPCDSGEAHDAHEHYGSPAAIRQNCPGCTCHPPYPDAACPSHGVVALLRAGLVDTGDGKHAQA